MSSIFFLQCLKETRIVTFDFLVWEVVLRMFEISINSMRVVHKSVIVGHIKPLQAPGRRRKGSFLGFNSHWNVWSRFIGLDQVGLGVLKIQWHLLNSFLPWLDWRQVAEPGQKSSTSLRIPYVDMYTSNSMKLWNSSDFFYLPGHYWPISSPLFFSFYFFFGGMSPEIAQPTSTPAPSEASRC